MHLENAKMKALHRLAIGGEVRLSSVDDGRRIWLGVGYCVGKGWAVYRGGDCYEITSSGRAALRSLSEDATS